jgi:hypothetical protein
MKTLKYFLLLFSAIAFITACNKKLDVLPQQNITPDQIQTADDVKALLFGNYSLFQNANGFGERLIFIADLLAAEDQVSFVGSFTNYKEVQNKAIVTNSTIPLGIWSNGYQVINLSNTVLSKIDLIDDAEKDPVTGEAEFFRGVMLFELVNYFAQPYSSGDPSTNPGVPIILSAPKYVYDSTSAFVSRASVRDVYNQVISDLTDAAAKLPDFADNARATKYAAEAFLSRVYMNMHDYENAAAMANDVIESGQFNLVSTFNQAFNNVGNSPEDIFGIQQTAQSNAGTTNNGIVTFYATYPTGRGDAQIDGSLEDNSGFFSHFEDQDFRKTYNYVGESIQSIEGYYTSKWSAFYKTIPVIRLAEMYLTRGEANLRKGGTPVGGVDPVDDINTVRERAAASPLDEVNGSDFVEERFRELSFEGDRLWTRKRLQLDIDGLPYDWGFLVLPIPQREIDVNKNLEQNEAYK